MTMIGRACTERTQHAPMLTPRERTILPLLAEGLGGKAIACRLDLTNGTVKVYLNRLRNKTGLTTGQLARAGWTDVLRERPVEAAEVVCALLRVQPGESGLVDLIRRRTRCPTT